MSKVLFFIYISIWLLLLPSLSSQQDASDLDFPLPNPLLIEDAQNDDISFQSIPQSETLPIIETSVPQESPPPIETQAPIPNKPTKVNEKPEIKPMRASEKAQTEKVEKAQEKAQEKAREKAQEKAGKLEKAEKMNEKAKFERTNEKDRHERKEKFNEKLNERDREKQERHERVERERVEREKTDRERIEREKTERRAKIQEGKPQNTAPIGKKTYKMEKSNIVKENLEEIYDEFDQENASNQETKTQKIEEEGLKEDIEEVPEKMVRESIFNENNREIRQKIKVIEGIQDERIEKITQEANSLVPNETSAKKASEGIKKGKKIKDPQEKAYENLEKPKDLFNDWYLKPAYEVFARIEGILLEIQPKYQQCKENTLCFSLGSLLFFLITLMKFTQWFNFLFRRKRSIGNQVNLSKKESFYRVFFIYIYRNIFIKKYRPLI